MKVKEVIEAIICKTGIEPLPMDKTCDQLMTGNEDMEVTGIVTTFMATVEVIREAIDQGANLIITHEPTWYTGQDHIDWLIDDPVYLEKRQLIEEHQIAIWRFHDHMHMCETDGIYSGLIKELGWENYLIPSTKICFEIPRVTLKALSHYLKEKMDMKVIQLVGNPESVVERVGILVGGGSLGLESEQQPMELMHQHNLEVMICGDILEWTLAAYIRDATMLGMNKNMIVLGHERSEEPGMKYLVEWLKPLVNGLPVDFISAQEPFLYE